MWAYSALLLVPLAIACSPPRARTPVYVVTFLALLAVIGLRHQVGCDWNPYLYMFVRAQRSVSLFEALSHATMGYQFLNWVVAKSGLGIAAVNTVCAFLLLGGIYSFCRIQPRPWIGFLISIPILIMLAGFGATRQGAAAGIFMYCLYLHLCGGRTRWIVALMLVAVTFHASALALLPVVFMMRAGWRLSIPVIIGLGSAAALVMGVLISIIYSGGLPVAEGGVFRVIPTILALLFFPVVWKRAELTAAERSLLAWLASLAVFTLVSGLFSTVVMDRFNYYAVPLQIALFCRAPGLAATRFQRGVVQTAVAAPFVILFVAWLVFTNSKDCVVPYRSYLSEPDKLLGTTAATDYRIYHDPVVWSAADLPQSIPQPPPSAGAPRL